MLATCDRPQSKADERKLRHYSKGTSQVEYLRAEERPYNTGRTGGYGKSRKLSWDKTRVMGVRKYMIDFDQWARRVRNRYWDVLDRDGRDKVLMKDFHIVLGMNNIKGNSRQIWKKIEFKIFKKLIDSKKYSIPIQIVKNYIIKKKRIYTYEYNINNVIWV